MSEKPAPNLSPYFELATSPTVSKAESIMSPKDATPAAPAKGFSAPHLFSAPFGGSAPANLPPPNFPFSNMNPAAINFNPSTPISSPSSLAKWKPAPRSPPVTIKATPSPSPSPAQSRATAVAPLAQDRATTVSEVTEVTALVVRSLPAPRRPGGEGDVTLRSRDGELIKVHSFALGNASPFFESVLTDEGRDEKVPIPFDEPSAVVRDIVKCLYVTSPRPLADLSDPEHAVKLLLAARKFEISSCLLEEATAPLIGALDPPLRAWALAIRGKNEYARKIAARRFFSVATTAEDWKLPELEFVNALQFNHLQEVKTAAVRDGQKAVERVISANLSSRCAHRQLPRFTKARLFPFQFDIISDAWFDDLHEFAPDMVCGHCINHREKTVDERKEARKALEAILDQAGKREYEGVD